MGKSAPATPAVPDPTVTAAAQGTANTSTAAAQAALDYVNQNTPYGSTAYDQTGSYTDPSGQTVPRYTQTTTLSPLGQSILTGEEGVTNTLIPAAQQLAGTVGGAINNPLNFNTADSGILNSTPQQLDTQAANAVYGQQKSFLDPQWNTQQAQLQDQLSRQGIPVGSDAYNNAMTNFNNAKTQAYQSAQDSATSQGASSAGQLFNMALTGQQQNVNQQQLAQSQPLSILQSLFGATPSSPTQPISQPGAVPVSPTDVIGATQNATNAAFNNYNAQIGQNNATTGALGSAVGSIGGLAASAFI